MDDFTRKKLWSGGRNDDGVVMEVMERGRREGGGNGVIDRETNKQKEMKKNGRDGRLLFIQREEISECAHKGTMEGLMRKTRVKEKRARFE